MLKKFQLSSSSLKEFYMGSYVKIEIFVPVSDMLGFSLIAALEPFSNSSLSMKNIIHVPKRRSSFLLYSEDTLKRLLIYLQSAPKIHSGMT